MKFALKKTLVVLLSSLIKKNKKLVQRRNSKSFPKSIGPTQENGLIARDLLSLLSSDF